MSDLACDIAVALVFAWLFGVASFIGWVVSRVEAATLRRCPRCREWT